MKLAVGAVACITAACMWHNTWHRWARLSKEAAYGADYDNKYFEMAVSLEIRPGCNSILNYS